MLTCGELLQQGWGGGGGKYGLTCGELLQRGGAGLAQHLCVVLLLHLSAFCDIVRPAVGKEGKGTCTITERLSRARSAREQAPAPPEAA